MAKRAITKDLVNSLETTIHIWDSSIELLLNCSEDTLDNLTILGLGVLNPTFGVSGSAPHSKRVRRRSVCDDDDFIAFIENS